MSAATGWVDDRLMQAYDLIYAVREAYRIPEDNLKEIGDVLIAIEGADEFLATVLKERNDETARDLGEGAVMSILENENGHIRELLSDALAGGLIHRSDCAVYHAPAYTPTPCDCGVGTWRDLCEGVVVQFNHAGCTCTFPDDKCCSYAVAFRALGEGERS